MVGYYEPVTFLDQLFLSRIFISRILETTDLIDTQLSLEYLCLILLFLKLPCLEFISPFISFIYEISLLMLSNGLTQKLKLMGYGKFHYVSTL